MLTVLYFASLREAFGRANEQVALPTPALVGSLVAVLRDRGLPWSVALGADRRWRVAVNQQMAALDTPLSAGDEVAIFPPVTGG
jgi:molybdopterin synthase sulfur carrier subunit